ncbi:outer membrane protein [Notoacmeibacter sp. MSK16QG-6]|uniref:outer membrane protein n=1 Tax=Notoacmeibacter sp. MSK16QG-6 TaxID=2957982 RepID=UPI00209F3261|nr:outer membrane beta-barrel protein [Notoacmeibacter sp. MSK16QG-6]MCP1199204.1 outer membrane beta-barrel protein [Notoacmeibacter sp. MSK16QG-6]
MKFLITLTSVLALGTAAANAADAVYVDEAPIAVETPAVEPGRFYIEARFGYGPALADLDVETAATTGTVLGGALAVDIPATNGTIESELLYGGVFEAGYFVTDIFRVGVEAGIGRLKNDYLDISDPAAITAPALLGATVGTIQDAQLDGGSTIYQGFIKGAVEVPVAHNIGFARQISVFGTAGIGLLHLDVDVEQENTADNNGTTIDDSDTVLAGKIGLGVATQLTDHISLVTEANYIFAEDGEFTAVTAEGTEIDTRIETEAITLQTGLRIRF